MHSIFQQLLSGVCMHTVQFHQLAAYYGWTLNILPSSHISLSSPSFSDLLAAFQNDHNIISAGEQNIHQLQPCDNALLIISDG